MDAAAREAHLKSMLADVDRILQHLEAHQAKLLTHHESKERGRALAGGKAALRRMDKARRHLERQLRTMR